MDLRRAIHELYQPVYQYAYRLTGSASDAEDLVQETFLMAFRHRDQLRDEGRLRAWLFGILRGCVGKYFSRRRPALAGNLELDLDRFPTEQLEEPIDQEALQAALLALPDEYRVVVLMFYFEELSYQQIAEALDLPMGTVMSRLARAKTHLRRRLQSDQDSAQP